MQEALRRFGEVRVDEPMARHTTFRVGGPADYMVYPRDADALSRIMELCNSRDVPALIVGNGSNLLVRDGGIRGVAVMTGALSGIELDGINLKAQSGAVLSKISLTALNAGLTGLEFASGIPGTLGGAVFMNAGAYGGQMSDWVVRGEVLLNGCVTSFSAQDFSFGYRSSRVQQSGGVILSAELALKRGDPDEIRLKMDDLNARRREKQPLDMPSAGSTFKRPRGYYAGTLIEQAGLKGYSIGGARVSEKHAGFLVNAGGASAYDLLSLIDHVRSEVMRQFGVLLEPEVRIVGR